MEKGAKNPNAKLTEFQVVEIRKRIDNKENMSKIGRDYNVAPNTIWEIKKGLSWRI